MRYCFLFGVIFFLFQTATSQPKVQIPKANPQRKSVVVTVTNENKIYIKNKEVQLSQLDSILKIEIDSIRERSFDSARVVINADPASHYGIVFTIMQAAKRLHAMVVATVK